MLHASLRRLACPTLPRLALPALALLAGGCTHDGVGAALSLEDTVQPRSNVMALAPGPGRPAAVTLSRPARI